MILVGEMRDLETISTALTAAETGHLVFATLHTQSTAQTVDRIIDVFPPAPAAAGAHAALDRAAGDRHPAAAADRRRLRPRLSPARCWSRRPAIRNLIREGKTHQIYSALQTSGAMGMQTMDAHLAQLVRAGKVTRALAEQRASVPEELKRLLAAGPSARAARRSPDTVEAIGEGEHLRIQGGRPRRRSRPRRDGGRRPRTVVSEQLRQRGLIVLDISEKREALKLESIFQRFKSVNLRALAVFSRQFATLIASGHADAALALHAGGSRPRTRCCRRRSSRCARTSRPGARVAEAMESQPGVFDPLYRSMVAAGEGSGRLEEALDRIANQLETPRRAAAARCKLGDDVSGGRLRARAGRDDRRRRDHRPGVRGHLQRDLVGQPERPTRACRLMTQITVGHLRTSSRTTGTS